MPDFQALYFQLFGAVADAVEHLENENYGLARQMLIAAQQQAEEAYISMDCARESETAR